MVINMLNTIARNNRGAALVEFALVASLLLMLVLGILETGLLIKDYLAIDQAAREGARSAAIGDTTTVAIQRVLTSAPTTVLTSANVTLERSATGSGWVVLTNNGAQNGAVAGDYIRVTVQLQHSWLTNLFSTTPTTILSKVVTRRE